MRRVFALGAALVALAAATPAAAIEPNDPAWFAAWGQRLVHMPLVWDITTGSPNVIVATVDTGIAPWIPDLQGALVPGWDFTTNSPDGTGDAQGHGTAVATEIAARGNNGTEIAGYCWGCRIMPVRVSVDGTASDDLVAAGIRWAVDHGARIINVGFNDDGTGHYESLFASAVAYAQAHGVLLFASAGNSGSFGITYPAGYPGAYAVAGTDPSDVLYPWSTFGAWVPFAAPGCQVVTYPWGEGELCGTSVTAPVLSGIAALLLSAKPNLTPGQVIAALRAGSVVVPGIGGGRIDALKAFASVGLLPPPPPLSPIQPGAQNGPGGAPNGARGVIPPRLPNATASVSGAFYMGTLRRQRTVRLRLAQGTLWLTLRSQKAWSCTLDLVSKSEHDVAIATARTKIRIVAPVAAGSYTVRIRCGATAPRPYSLEVIGPLTS